MKVIDVQPRDFLITAEFTLTQINMFLDYLDHCVVTYDSQEEPTVKKADDYVRGVWREFAEIAENVPRDSSD